jgi:hypothetical protein
VAQSALKSELSPHISWGVSAVMQVIQPRHDTCFPSDTRNKPAVVHSPECEFQGRDPILIESRQSVTTEDQLTIFLEHRSLRAASTSEASDLSVRVSKCRFDAVTRFAAPASIPDSISSPDLYFGRQHSRKSPSISGMPRTSEGGDCSPFIDCTWTPSAALLGYVAPAIARAIFRRSVR